MRLNSKMLKVLSASVILAAVLLTGCGGDGEPSTGGSGETGGNGGTSISGGQEDYDSNTGSDADKDQTKDDTDAGTGENGSTDTDKEEGNAVGVGSFPTATTWQKSKTSQCYSSPKYTINAVNYLQFGKDENGDPDYWDSFSHVTTNGTKVYTEEASEEGKTPTSYKYSDKEVNKTVVVSNYTYQKLVREETYRTSRIAMEIKESDVQSIRSGSFTYTFKGQNKSYPAEKVVMKSAAYGIVNLVICYDGNAPKLVLAVDGNGAPYAWMELKSYSTDVENDKLDFDINTLKQKFLDEGYQEG